MPSELAGISLVFGNTDDLAYQESVTRALLKFFPSVGTVPVSAGATEKSDARETAAVRSLTAALDVAPRTVLALGRLSNLAQVLKRRPDLESRVQELIVVGGRRVDDLPKFGPRAILS